MRAPTTEGTVRLRDGRLLGYTDQGAGDGAPVLHFHGIPGSRLEIFPALVELADEAGIRLITLDRPGIGLSDPKPRRTILDWAGDVASFAEALGLERFAVEGYSGGAPYAAACAYALPERVSAAALVSGAAPPEAGLAAAGRSRADRTMSALARRAPPIARALIAALPAVLERRPDWLIDGFAREARSEADRRLLAEPVYREVVLRSIRESARGGTAGLAQDFALEESEWGFELGSVELPVTVFHGHEDRIVSPEHGRYVAAALPNAELAVWPREGHLHGVERWWEVLAALAG